MHPILMTLFLLVTTALAATINPLHAVNTTRDARPPNPIIPTSSAVTSARPATATSTGYSMT